MHHNLFIFLKHLSEVIQDTVGDYNKLTHDRQIQRAKKKATMLNDKRVKTSIDKFAAGVCSWYEFLSAVSHMADNLPTKELEDISSSDDDETETYDVDEALAATTPPSSSASETSEEVAPPVATAEPAVCEVCLLEPKSPLALVPCTWTLPLL